jgi:hypothetical protein
MGRGLRLGRLAPFPTQTEVQAGVRGISQTFARLFPSQGKIVHVLLTRLPLSLAGSLDLHVSGLPPAFALSQDQTLRSIERGFIGPLFA